MLPTSARELLEPSAADPLPPHAHSVVHGRIGARPCADSPAAVLRQQPRKIATAEGLKAWILGFCSVRVNVVPRNNFDEKLEHFCPARSRSLYNSGFLYLPLGC